MTCTEEEATNDQAIRKTVKDLALEVEKAEGQRKVRVRPPVSSVRPTGFYEAMVGYG